MEHKGWNSEVFSKLFTKKNWLFFAGLAGIFLIFLSNFFTGDKSGQKKAETAASDQDSTAYVSQMEARLTELIGSVQGAGKTSVMITLESTGETVYAQDQKTDTQTQKNSTGDVDEKNTMENEHILVDTDANGQQALVETQRSPQICGVAVVCEGGGDFTVVARVTELVSVVLGVSSNRICVTQML